MSHLHTSNHMMWGDIYIYMCLWVKPQHPKTVVWTSRGCHSVQQMITRAKRNVFIHQISKLGPAATWPPAGSNTWTAELLRTSCKDQKTSDFVVWFCLSLVCKLFHAWKLHAWGVHFPKWISEQHNHPKWQDLNGRPYLVLHVFFSTLGRMHFGVYHISTLQKANRWSLLLNIKTFPPLAIKHGNGKYRFIYRWFSHENLHLVGKLSHGFPMFTSIYKIAMSSRHVTGVILGSKNGSGIPVPWALGTPEKRPKNRWCWRYWWQTSMFADAMVSFDEKSPFIVRD